MCGVLEPGAAALLPDADLLVAVTDRLLGTCPADLPGAVALERTRALLVQTERLRAAALAAVGDLDARQLYALDGAASASAWLARERVGGRAAPVTTARRLADHPAVTAALAAGRLDVLGADRVCAALSRLPGEVDEQVVSAVLGDGVRTLLQELVGAADLPDEVDAVLGEAATASGTPLPERVEPVLVLLAQRVPPALLVRTTGLLVDALLPEEHLERWEREQAQTYLDVRDLLDGYADVKGVLDPETAVLLRRCLARRALAARQQGSDGLSAGQRRVLALRQVLRDALVQSGGRSSHEDDSVGLGRDDAPFGDDGEGGGDHGGEFVEDDRGSASHGDGGERAEGDCEQADGEQADGEADADAADAIGAGGPDAPLTPPAADGSSVQLTLVTRTPAPLAGEGSVPLLASVDAVLALPGALPGRFGPGLTCSLPVAALRRLGCGGRLAAVLLDAAGTPVGASGSHRHATRRERRALLAQWGGICATDGCGRPGVVPHHAEPWWLTHRTRLADLVPYCDGCHHDLHEGGRTLRLRNGRWVGPTGWTSPPDEALDAG